MERLAEAECSPIKDWESLESIANEAFNLYIDLTNLEKTIKVTV